MAYEAADTKCGKSRAEASSVGLAAAAVVLAKRIATAYTRGQYWSLQGELLGHTESGGRDGGWYVVGRAIRVLVVDYVEKWLVCHTKKP